MAADQCDLVIRIEALERDRALLMAEREIIRTIHRYGHSIDLGAEEDWLDCFTAEGIFDVRRRPPPTRDARSYKPPARCVGRHELADFAARHTRPPELYHNHMVGSTVVTVRGNTATAVSKFARLDAAPDGTPAVVSFGRYHDRLAHCADGRWRLTERVAEVLARGPAPP